MFEQPAAKHALEVAVREWDIIGITEVRVNSLLAIVLYKVSRVVHRDDVSHVLFREPTPPRPKIEYGLFACEPRPVPERSVDKLQIPHDSRAGSQDVISVRLPRSNQVLGAV
jgi:hypothetical protein